MGLIEYHWTNNKWYGDRLWLGEIILKYLLYHMPIFYKKYLQIALTKDLWVFSLHYSSVEIWNYNNFLHRSSFCSACMLLWATAYLQAGTFASLITSVYTHSKPFSFTSLQSFYIYFRFAKLIDTQSFCSLWVSFTFLLLVLLSTVNFCYLPFILKHR